MKRRRPDSFSSSSSSSESDDDDDHEACSPHVMVRSPPNTLPTLFSFHALLPEMQEEVHSHCPASAQKLLAMTCHAEWDRLFEWQQQGALLHLIQDAAQDTPMFFLVKWMLQGRAYRKPHYRPHKRLRSGGRVPHYARFLPYWYHQAIQFNQLALVRWMHDADTRLELDRHDCPGCAKAMILADNGLQIGLLAIGGLRHLVRVIAMKRGVIANPRKARLRDQCIWVLGQSDDLLVHFCFTQWRMREAWNLDQFALDIQRYKPVS